MECVFQWRWLVETARMIGWSEMTNWIIPPLFYLPSHSLPNMSNANPTNTIYADHFIIEKSLGEGMFGKVKLATNIRNNKQVL